MKTLTRDDTVHGTEYVLRAEAEAAIDAAIDQANARQNAAWRLMCAKMVAAERERCVPDVDELAQHIRWLNGSNKTGAGRLAEKLVDWLRSRA